MGEAWHNIHHAFQRSAAHRLDRWQLDVSSPVIGLLVHLRLVADVQRIAPDMMARKRLGQPSRAV
jgi:fatty-acid desaturase